MATTTLNLGNAIGLALLIAIANAGVGGAGPQLRSSIADGGRTAVRVALNRPEVRNAFRPHTVDELYRVLDHARMSSDVGCVLLTGNGPSPKDGGWAFCSRGDQRIRGRDGYRYAEGETDTEPNG